jgi:hypothetical protein
MVIFDDHHIPNFQIWKATTKHSMLQEMVSWCNVLQLVNNYEHIVLAYNKHWDEPMH